MLNLSLNTSPLIPSPIRWREPRCDLGLFPPLPHAENSMWLCTVAPGNSQTVSRSPICRSKTPHQPYNLLHAIRRRTCSVVLREDTIPPIEDRRPIIINDLKILAQARRMDITVILTEDRNTLYLPGRPVAREGLGEVRALLFADGFTPGRIAAPGPG